MGGRPSGALRQDTDTPAGAVLKAVIDNSCLSPRAVACRVCGDFCDARAIHFPPTVGGLVRPLVDHAACTGCGACVAPCPAGAIAMKG